jgi:tetratricopeptide (TPR) repeat protein
MKKIIFFAFALLLWVVERNPVQAQIVTPDASPFAKISQRIGFSDVDIEYSRPSVRGRVIFGDLVPYGKVWRLGANSSTKLYVREELTIQDQYKLMPGVYSLFAIPGKDEWTIIVNKNSWGWGAFKYEQGLDAIRFTAKPEALKEQVETFTIQFANVCTNCTELQFLWDFTKVSFKLTTNVDEKVMAQIKTFTTQPESKLAGEYYLAAKYYADTDRDLKQALEWTNKALQYGPGAYWVKHLKAEIYSRMGDYKMAIETATESRDEAKAKNDEDYVRMNEKEIAKWKALKKVGTD